MKEDAVGVAHARFGLLGNPSDGYGGKAIAASFADFRARVRLEAAEGFAIRPAPSDLLEFAGLDEAARAYEAVGCEGGQRLIKAAILRFVRHWPGFAALPPGDARLCFSVSCESDIPRQVGLSGSSAIVVATLRGLMDWFGVGIPPATLAELALAAELEELRIAAGPMDRVIQCYEGCVLMDLREPRSAASYRRLDPALLPPLFVAWNPRGGESSGLAHGGLRERWLRGDEEVLRVVAEYRNLVDEGVGCLERGDHARFRELVNRNFDLRASIYPIAACDLEMVDVARRHGAAAKLCGSGGAVVGTPEEESDLEPIAAALRAAGFEFLRPQVVPPREEGRGS